nr:heparinase II/III family protein [Clostridia bacterium]
MGKRIFEDRGYIGKAAKYILPYESFKPYCDIDYDRKAAVGNYGDYFIKAAEELLDEPYPILPASMYMQFVRIGNRSNFEELYFKRRKMTFTFVLAELAEGKGRFTDRAIDGVWAILEESTWLLPAHNSGLPLPVNYAEGIKKTDAALIDLFSAGTGAMMAMLWYLTEDLFDSETPIIRERMLAQLKDRILEPYYNYERDWWQGVKGNRLNNWTPWIVSNILTTAALCEQDTEKRIFAAEKAMTILDRFTAPYPDDGGCDEGPGYWNVAAASYFDALEVLYDLSGGKINIFDEELVGRMCEYIMNVRLSDGLYLNFADASAKINPDFRLISRMGRRLDKEQLSAYASSIVNKRESINLNESCFYRSVRNLVEPIPEPIEYTPPKRIWFPNLQIAINHSDSGMCLAAKGGCNAESHNHNDVGQYVICDGNIPIAIDAGVDTYTRQTFSSERYKLWAMRSVYHNVPQIGGIEQKPGGQYRAELIGYGESDGRLTLELKGAYPEECGIKSYIRSTLLDGDTVKITDCFRLDSVKEVSLNCLLLDKPEIEDNKALLPSGHTIEFDRSLKAELEPINTAGTRIGAIWQRDTLWKLSLKATVINDAFVTKISRT